MRSLNDLAVFWLLLAVWLCLCLIAAIGLAVFTCASYLAARIIPRLNDPE